jgi:DNA-binding MarR family transcriptional regulator
MWHLFPTETGSALYEGLIEEENRQITAGLRGFTPEETRDLLLLVKKLQGNIQLGWQKQH